MGYLCRGSLGSQCVVARFAQKHLTGICAAVSVESQYVLARFARRHLWGICATVSVGSQCVGTRFARRYLWGICGAVSDGSQGVVARFARLHLWGICAAVSVGSQCVVFFSPRGFTQFNGADLEIALLSTTERSTKYSAVFRAWPLFRRKCVPRVRCAALEVFNQG